MNDLSTCPKCGSPTNTYRHPYAKVWCTECGFILRKEGEGKPVAEDNLDIDINLKPGLWKHFKGGIYDVIGTAKHSETGEQFAVYRHADGGLWIRPVKMFLEEIPGIGPRFRRIEQ